MEDSIQKVIDAIKETPEYTDYKKFRTELYKDPDLWVRAERIKKEYDDVLSITDERQIMNALDAFMERNEEDYAITAIHDSLEAESSFYKMLQKVLDRIVGDVRS